MPSISFRKTVTVTAFALLAYLLPNAHCVFGQTSLATQNNINPDDRDAAAMAKALALSEEVLAFTSKGYKAVPAEQLLPQIDSFLVRMHALASEIAGTPAAAKLADFIRRFEQARGNIVAVQSPLGRAGPDVAGTSQDRNTMALHKVRTLLAEAAAAKVYTDLPPRQRLAALDTYLVRLQNLGPEVAGTRAAPYHENALQDARRERATVAAQLERANATPPNAPEGAYTDYEWMGQRAVMALNNPLQRSDFQASLMQGIDFNVGVSSIEQVQAGWLVQLSGRLGSPGTPGQGFFCRVAPSNTASLAVLRRITPPYGIVHITSPGIDEFVMQDRPVRIRIVFNDCQVTEPSDRPNDRESGRSDGSSRVPTPEPLVREAKPVAAPSPPDLRCTTRPSRFAPEYAMARRLRQAWVIPDALRADPSLMLTFAVTLDFDAKFAGCAAPLTLAESASNAGVAAADRAIRETAPFPELGQNAGGTMQIDMTPCD